jgi:hypothetical protein
MTTKTKSVIGAIVLAGAGVLVATYVPEGERESVLVSLALIVGWLGFGQPGTKAK